MKKAILLDFYGTIVYEDGDNIKVISDRILKTADRVATTSEIGAYWWKSFHDLFVSSYGNNFKTQRKLEILSLRDTINYFKSTEDVIELSDYLFKYWVKPPIFSESKEFLQSVGIPICIVSNIDRSDILNAMEYHQLKVDCVITSEDVRSYKPRPEIFHRALEELKLSVDEVIHIGDSLSSDIQAARDLGIATVWINRNHKKLPEDLQIDEMCYNLMEILNRGIV